MDERTRTRRRSFRQVVGEEEEDLRLIEVSPEVQTHLSGQRQLDKLDLFRPKPPKLLLSSSSSSTADAHLPEQVNTNHRRPPTDEWPTIDTAQLVTQQQQQQLQHLRQLPQPLRRPKLAGPRASGATYPAANHPNQVNTNTIKSNNNHNNSDDNNNYINRLYLDSTMPLEVQAHVGSTAYLVCRLRSMQQPEHLQVSWVRNMQILTSGELRYTSDERFRPTHVAGSHDWALEIHQVGVEDEGEYECQVNSEPKAASVSLYLDVVTASIEILEPSPLQVEEGGAIRLTCRVEFNSQAHNLSRRQETEVEAEEEDGTGAGKIGRAALSSQHYIYWYKSPANGEHSVVSLEYNNPRGGVRVERRESPSRLLESVLTLEEASPSDSGLYLCRILPELNEVAPAECRVSVGGSTAAGSTSGGGFSFSSFHPFGASNGAANGIGGWIQTLLLLACLLLPATSIGWQ